MPPVCLWRPSRNSLLQTHNQTGALGGALPLKHTSPVNAFDSVVLSLHHHRFPSINSNACQGPPSRHRGTDNIDTASRLSRSSRSGRPVVRMSIRRFDFGGSQERSYPTGRLRQVIGVFRPISPEDSPESLGDRRHNPPDPPPRRPSPILCRG